VQEGEEERRGGQEVQEGEEVVRRRFLYLVVLAIAVAALIAVPGAGATDPCTVTWDGGGGNNLWSTATNWSGDAVPTSSDKACVTNGATVVHSSGSDAVGGLESDGLLTISGGTLAVGPTFDSAITGSLTVSGGEAYFNRALTVAAVTLSGGILHGTGTLETPTFNWSGGVLGWFTQGTGTTRITAGGSGLSISGSTAKTIGGRTLEVASGATATQTGTGNIEYSTGILGPARINNSGTWTVSGDSDVVGVFGTSWEFKNLAGATFEKTSGTAETTLAVSFTNDGTVEAESGQVNLASSNISGDDHDGTFTASSGAILRLSGTNTFASGSQITGAGTGKVQSSGITTVNGTYNPPVTEITGSTATFNGASTPSSPSLILSGGVLAGTATFETPSFTWSGGTIGNATASGTTRVTSGGTGLAVSNTPTITNRTLLIASGASASQGSQINFLASTAVAKIHNSGTWTVPGDSDLVSTGGSDNEFANLAGATFEKTSGSAETTIGIRFTNDGTTEVESGQLNLSGANLIGNNHDGAFTASTGATLRLTGTNTFASGSQLTGAGTGKIQLAGGTSTINGTFNPPVTEVTSGTHSLNGATATSPSLTQSGGILAGTATFETPSYTWSGGNLGDTTAAGTTRVTSGGTGLAVTNTNTPQLVNRTLEIASGVAATQSGNILLQTAAKIHNSGTWTIPGDSDLTNAGGATSEFKNLAGATFEKTSGSAETTIGIPFTNDGRLEVEAGTVYASTSLTNFSSATKKLTGGTYVVNGTFKFASADIVTNEAAIELDGSSSQIINEGSLSGLRNLATNASTGDLTIKNGRDLTTPGALTNAGDVVVGQNSDLASTGNYTQSGGSTALEHSTATLTATGGMVQLNGGVLEGTGTVGPSLVNAAEVQPGTSPGKLNVSGSYTQQAGGTLRAEINSPGATAGIDYDQLDATGAVSLNGTLAIERDSGYDPGELDAHRIVEGSSRTGTFSTVTGTNLPNNRSYTVQYNADNVTLAVSPAPSASIGDVTVTEGNSPGTVQADFTISLNSAPASTASVNWATADDTATQPADYTSASGTATFAPGDQSETVTVTVKGDDLDEVDERFLVNLSSPVAATISDSQAQGTITDDDPAPSMSIGDVEVTEGNSGQVNANLVVTLGAGSGKQVTVDFETENETATQPADYAQASGTLTFAPGDTSETVTVQVAGDTLDESNETFLVKLSNAVNATVTDGQGRATIADDDTDPTAVDDAATVGEDSGATAIDVLANDTDPEGDPRTISTTSDPPNGTVVLTGGSPGARTGLTYQPDANYCNDPPGTNLDTFTYTINGGSTAAVSVTVTCVDDNPTAVNDSATKTEDSGATAIDVLANDTDPDGGTKTIQSASDPANGTVQIAGDNLSLTYAPDANYCNDGAPPDDTFTYTVNGGSQATVSVAVTCVDDNPVAVNDSATVDRSSGPNSIDVLANDTDVDSGTKSIESTTDPANGTVVITGGGSALTYEPDGIYCNDPPGTNPDTFTYTLNGGSQATVSVTVNCIDLPPVAVADAATVNEDAGATAVDVLANDQNPDGGTMAIASASDPANGTVVLTGGTSGAHTGLTYQPDANYCNSGVGGVPDTFTYTLNGGSQATVSMTVTCADDAPVAVDDGATKTEDSGATSIDVLANDTDVDGGPKSIQSTSDPANGTAVITGGGSGLTYAPDANYCNDGAPPDDTFTYTLNGGSQATVSVTVTCVDDNPVAVDDAPTVQEDAAATQIDVRANDTDIDAGPKTISSASDPANGTVQIAGDNLSLIYQPDPNYCNDGAAPDDTFTYTLNGGSIATVSVAVTCIDDSPVAVDDAAMVQEDAAATMLDVRTNDTDVDGGPKNIASASDPGNGTVQIAGDNLSLSYRPDPDYCNDPPGTAPDTFTYTLNGGSIATVSVAVACLDEPQPPPTTPTTPPSSTPSSSPTPAAQGTAGKCAKKKGKGSAVAAKKKPCKKRRK